MTVTVCSVLVKNTVKHQLLSIEQLFFILCLLRSLFYCYRGAAVELCQSLHVASWKMDTQFECAVDHGHGKSINA